MVGKNEYVSFFRDMLISVKVQMISNMQVLSNTFGLTKYLWEGAGRGISEDEHYLIFILRSSNLDMIQNKMLACKYIRYLRK